MHLLNPGVIDTELFHLPDNDPMIAEVEAACDRGGRMTSGRAARHRQLSAGLPAWFGDVANAKATDLMGYPHRLGPVVRRGPGRGPGADG